MQWEILADLKTRLGRRLPGLRSYVVARRSLKRYRPRHFRPLGFIAPPPSRLVDRSREEIEAINRRSRAYFENEDNRNFWMNRPYSDPAAAGKDLWRLGLLVSALGIRPGDRVLDFGCGTGWTSLLLARIGAETVGMDIAPAALAIGREAAENGPDRAVRERLHFAEYAGDVIDAPDGCFDFVLVFDAFHHFPNPLELLGELHRVLAPHGRFGFSEPGIGHAQTELSLAESEHGVLEQDLDLEQLYRSAAAVGFKELELLVPPVEPGVLTLPMKHVRRFLRGASWLVPSDLIRTAMLTGPIGILRKGPYPVTSLHPRTQRATLRPEKRAVSVASGDRFEIPTSVVNRGDTVWLREGRRGIGYVRLGAHLLDAGDRLLSLDYGRADLPRDIQRGEKARIRLELQAPSAPGSYIVRLDMVNEGLCWFGDEGSETADVILVVTGRES